MKVKELIEALQKLPQDLPVGSVGHFGELDQEVDSVTVYEDDFKYGVNTPRKFVGLGGILAGYPEPD